MFSSQLFRRIFRLLLLLVLGYALVLYLVSAPFISQAASRLETRAARNVLSNFASLVESQHYAIKAHEEALLEARKAELRNLALIQEGVIKQYHEMAQKGILTEDAAQKAYLSYVRNVRYGNNDYFWVSDYRSLMLSHPDQDILGRDFSRVKDAHGKPVVPPLVDIARNTSQGGYYTYFWRRLGETEPVEKISFALEYPPWQWVLGTGVYVDDVKREVESRRATLLENLAGLVKSMAINNSGYITVFDSRRSMVIDPEPEVGNEQTLEQVNPVTGNVLADDLMAAARTPEQRLDYKWDRPFDKGSYTHGKVSWVRHFEPLDWYIVNSAYVEDMRAGAVALTNRILWMTALLVLLSVIASTLFIRRFLSPLRRLWETARRVEEGDLSAQAMVEGEDELAMLASTFNSMVRRLKENIEKLDENVRCRTFELDEKNAVLKDEVERRGTTEDELKRANEKLTQWITELEQRNREMGVLNEFSDMLLACHFPEEAFAVASEAAASLFPESSGALFLFNDEKTVLAPMSVWGKHGSSMDMFGREECWAIRRGKIQMAENVMESLGGTHVLQQPGYGSLCAPLVGQGEVLGIFHVLFPTPDQELAPGQKIRMAQSRLSLATAVADHLSLSLINLRLRERLQDLSVRDPLTGLFNRRYMEESLLRELSDAARTGNPVGVVMMDVDHFKNYNDSFGHEAGDRLLKALGDILVQGVRGGDVACRYGGEEFLLILPGATLDATRERADALRVTAFEQLAKASPDPSKSVTISAGVAVYPEHGEEPQELINAADSAMYRAKSLGRNRVEAADETSASAPVFQ
ncbi:MAG: cache domain-containing protein [Deltaproteobacteria bacterium]|nr:cache domain-containing protein [Deltaproteobacteria bacterium]